MSHTKWKDGPHDQITSIGPQKVIECYSPIILTLTPYCTPYAPLSLFLMTIHSLYDSLVGHTQSGRVDHRIKFRA